jgi:glycosyltransferase involved in cell wall biosynthesis
MQFRRRIDLSVIIVSYRMSREIPRTAMTLSRGYQRELDGIEYEVLVVDNGSPEPSDAKMFSGLDGRFRVHNVRPAPASPAYAANLGISMTKGRYVCVILDGARMLTPGTLATGLASMQLHPRAIATTLAWHLGSEHQSLSIPKGYGAQQEDELLKSIDFPADGYRLFEISALAGANPDGFFGGINESCCLFLSRGVWDEVGGYDVAFDLAGGGLMNLDLFTRLLEVPDSRLVILLGEGSFHQVHGGASSAPGADHAAWHDQYQKLRGRPYSLPELSRPLYFGSLPSSARRWLGQ